MTSQNDDAREYDQHDICDDIAASHKDEPDIALATLTSDLWQDLPVVMEGLALGQVADGSAYESCQNGPSDE